MLEITKKNCCKCDLETVIDNNSQYFWINLRDFEAETENKWLNIFNKYGNKSTSKYRRELTPDIKFQADRMFVRNDLFEQVIKSCKSNSTKFLMLKEKLGICLYEENYYKEEIIQIQDEEPNEEISKLSNKKSTKKLIEESDNESIEESDNKSNKESDNESNKESDNESIEKINKESEEEFIEDLKQPFSLNNKSTTNRYDKNKFNKILTTIDSKKFNHKNKIGKFKFNDLINNIKNNAINEAATKVKINELNKIKKVETKGKRLIKSQEKLLRLFDDLKTIFDNNSNNNNSNNNSNNSNDNNESNNNNEINNKNETKNENENVNESHNQQYYEMEQINDDFKNIDEIKSFKNQADMLKEIPYLSDYWYIEYYEDNKERNLRLFKL